MEKLVLKFDEQYQNFSALSPIQADIVSAPQDVTEIINASVQTFSFNVKMKKPLQVIIKHDEQEHLLTTLEGEITLQARGSQFNADIHKVGNSTLFNINYKPGAEGVLLSAAPLQQVVLQKPKVTPFVFEQNLVEQNF